MQSLEHIIDERIKSFPVTTETGKLMMFLEKIKEKHKPTYLHSLRVGMKCMDAASLLEYNEKEMFDAGLLHDVGKLAVPVELLKKTNFTKEDHKAMDIHPVYSYHILLNELPLTAEVALRHHRYESKKKPYPQKLPAVRRDMDLTKICAYARLLSVIDCYDAMTTRHDNHQLEGHNYRDALMAERKGMEGLIERLFEAKILA
ncbi:MAG: HD domain-containing protein [Nanoarchaeota archaeon]|nr:HD domain-containing protein [Nanoarchaeota archaeon]